MLWKLEQTEALGDDGNEAALLCWRFNCPCGLLAVGRVLAG